MEENVALDSTKQKQFNKSIKGIKKLLKGKGGAVDLKKEHIVKYGKVGKPKQKKRGLVYLSHIPHGFYEHQMTEYFKQFGVVTNARVIRSKRTGMSKGHAFVEFRDPNVAEIVAETMNNYLMGKRLIKAALIPPEKQKRFAKRKNWNAQNNPGNDLRQKMKKAHNAVKDESEELKNARRLLSNLSKTKKKLRELDIDYDFFTPVDIPEALANLVEVKKEEVEVKSEKDTIKEEKKPNKKIKQEESLPEEKNTSKKNKKNKSANIEIKDEETKLPKQTEVSANKKSKPQPKSEEINQTNKKNNIKTSNIGSEKVAKVDKKVTKENKDLGNVPKDSAKSKNPAKEGKGSKIQEQKQQKLKDAGVKPPEDFIQIEKDSGDESDSSVDFDSDEYEKVIEQDSEIQSDDESDETDEDLDEDITSEEDEAVENEPPTPPKKTRPQAQTVSVTQSKKKNKNPNTNKPAPQPMKRMNPNLDASSKPTKKPKFEKKANKKTLNKVIKKKK